MIRSCFEEFDGRSVVARRYRDVAIALADDLGGKTS